MLSYRHAFHAGNHADVLKHFLLYCVLDYYNQKDKPYWYIDTHSGAGIYDLQGSEAQKVGEFADGIGRLGQAALPTNCACSNCTPPISNTCSTICAKPSSAAAAF